MELTTPGVALNSILPEVRNYPKHKRSVARGKRISIYYDRTKREFVGLDNEQLNKLSEAYPNANVGLELKKMSIWLESPKGLRRKGDIAFIMNWLGNAHPSSAPANKQEDPIEKDTPIRPEINTYLKGLWKGREHILEMNKKKS